MCQMNKYLPTINLFSPITYKEKNTYEIKKNAAVLGHGLIT